MNKSKRILIILAIIILLGMATLVTYKKLNKTDYTRKENIIALLDKGLKSSSEIKIFIIMKEYMEDDYKKIFNEGKYKELIGFIDLNKYKEEKYEFIYMREDENSVLGYFSENDNNTDGTIYIRINKRNGELIDLDSNLLKVTIY